MHNNTNILHINVHTIQFIMSISRVKLRLSLHKYITTINKHTGKTLK